MHNLICSFFERAPDSCGPIYNERSLQLELACYFRAHGAQVEFERSFEIKALPGSTCTSKRNLDLFVRKGGQTTAIELKVPLNGQHPETLYSFCNDIAFVEGIVRAKQADSGFCLMVTNDPVFWTDSRRGSPVHDLFRCKGSCLTGAIQKPTGQNKTTVILSGRYTPADRWISVRDNRLIDRAQYLAIEIQAAPFIAQP